MRTMLSLLAALAAGPAQAEDAGEAWERIHEVFSHPRCVNCHVGDGVPMWSGPHYGETRPHGMFVGGDPENQLGEPGAMCTDCHGPSNATLPHGPPGAVHWLLPPPEFAWFGRDAASICRQVRDPERNGGRSFEDLAEHISGDPLVLWGWQPGPGREPAPHSPDEIARLILVWGEAGAPCPGE